MAVVVNLVNIRCFVLFDRTVRVHGARLALRRAFIANVPVQEEYRDIPAFSRYQISSLGNVKNKKLNKLRFVNYDRFRKLNHPAFCILLRDCGKNKNFLIGRLVLQVFDPRINDDSLCALHIDGNKFNNHLSNLRWGERRDIDPSKKGRGPDAVILKNETENIELTSARHCKQYLQSIGIHCSTDSIARWCRCQAHGHGFHFMYKDKTKYACIVDDPDEEWKLFHTSIKTFTYYVSSKGRIKRVTNGGKARLLSSQIMNGYCTRVITYKTKLIHRVVAEHFVANPNDYEMVDHIDANRLNNCAANLRWVANQKENYENPVSRERQSYSSQNKQNVLQISLIDDSIIQKWDRAFCVQSELGYNSGYIQSVCRGRAKSAYGYKWRFV